MLRVCIQESKNHALILCVVLLCFVFEKINAASSQRERNFHAILTKHKILWWWEEIPDNLQRTDWLIRLLDFRAHKVLCPFSNSLLRESEGRPLDV